MGCLHPGIQYKWNVNWTLIEIQYQSRMLGARRSYQYMKLDMSCCFVWFLSQYIGMYPTPAKYPLSFRSQLRFHAKLRCQELPTSLDVKPTCCENKLPAGNQTAGLFPIWILISSGPSIAVFDYRTASLFITSPRWEGCCVVWNWPFKVPSYNGIRNGGAQKVIWFF